MDKCEIEKTKYLILGAGPAGLTFANRLLQKGERDFLVLEAEDEVGGLCRSKDVDGSPLDIGGGHFLDVRRPQVNEFLFGFMPEEEWNLYDRDSKIHVSGQYVDHPLEANIWQMDEEHQAEYLDSISKAGCVLGEEMPERFVDWIHWKLGEKISTEYMIPYNSKIFSANLNSLGTYWLDKLPDVSYEDTLESCREKRPIAKQPGHARFYYPKKYGYGELWRRMGKKLGDKVFTGRAVTIIDFEQKIVTVKNGEKYSADCIISTIPWTSIDVVGMPEDLSANITKLTHSSVRISYHQENLDTKAHWIYEPDLTKDYHRILVRHNFCQGSRGYWTETNEERVDNQLRDSAGDIFQSQSWLMEYAYPLNTLGKPEIMDALISFSRDKKVYPLGRWGEHMHYNSDLVVQKALELADGFLDGQI